MLLRYEATRSTFRFKNLIKQGLKNKSDGKGKETASFKYYEGKKNDTSSHCKETALDRKGGGRVKTGLMAASTKGVRGEGACRE